MEDQHDLDMEGATKTNFDSPKQFRKKKHIGKNMIEARSKCLKKEDI